jgi:hypothetical protein
MVLKSGSLNLLEPLVPVQACNVIALPLPLPYTKRLTTEKSCFSCLQGKEMYSIPCIGDNIKEMFDIILEIM